MTKMTRAGAATAGLLIPATLALSMSADTSYRFLGAALQITDHNERIALCGVAEAAIVALTTYAWATRTKGPAYLAYAAVLVQAIPAFQVSGSVGGPVRVILGPVLLAVLLHLLLGLELRMSGTKPNGLLGSALRELRERLTALLGIGRRGADSAAIARSRAADRVVDLADRVSAAKPGSRRHTRLSGRLAAKIDAARHGLSPDEAAAAEAAIVARVVRRKSVTTLAGIAVRHDWSMSLAVSPAPAVPLGDAGTRDMSPAASVPSGDKGTAPVVPAVSRVPAPAVPVSPAPAPAVPEDVPVVSRTRVSVPAAVSPRPSVRIRVDKTPEEISAERDTPRDTVSLSSAVLGDSPVEVPEDKLSSLSGAVRFLMETGHDRDEVRAIVPTLPGHKDPKPDSLKKAIQRAEKALASTD